MALPSVADTNKSGLNEYAGRFTYDPSADGIFILNAGYIFDINIIKAEPCLELECRNSTGMPVCTIS